VFQVAASSLEADCIYYSFLGPIKFLIITPTMGSSPIKFLIIPPTMGWDKLEEMSVGPTLEVLGIIVDTTRWKY
jgi:hypothetical protein